MRLSFARLSGIKGVFEAIADLNTGLKALHERNLFLLTERHQLRFESTTAFGLIHPKVDFACPVHLAFLLHGFSPLLAALLIFHLFADCRLELHLSLVRVASLLGLFLHLFHLFLHFLLEAFKVESFLAFAFTFLSLLASAILTPA